MSPRQERLLRRIQILGLTTVLAAFIGCASSGPPVSTAEVSRAEDAVRAAENAQAAQDARDLLDHAHVALAAARREWQAGHYDAARRYLAEAETAAKAAEVRCRVAQLERQLAAETRDTEALEKQIHDLSVQLQTER
jgi:hypothetical protein